MTVQTNSNILSSDRAAFINMCKSFVGAGILGLPYGIKNGGLYFGVLGVLILSGISCYCVSTLVTCKVDLELHSYSDVGRAAFGKWGGVLVDVVIITCQLGFVCAYLMIIGKTLHELHSEIHTGFYILMVVPFLIPLTWLRSFKFFEPLSIITLIVFTVGCTVVFVYGFQHIEIHPYKFIKLDTIGKYFGTVVFAFEGINLMVPIQDNMKNPNHFKKLLYASYTFVTIVFVVFAGLSYMFFGDKTESIITLNLPSGPFTSIVQLSFAIVVFLTFPIGLFPIIQIVESWIFPENLLNGTDGYEQVLNSPSRSDNSASGVTVFEKKRWFEWKRNAVRTALVLGCTLLTLLIPTFGDLMEFFGSFSNALAAFILPAVFYIKLMATRGITIEYVANIMIVCLGVLAAGVSTVISVVTMVNDWSKLSGGLPVFND